jgi:hypothetical protein
MYMITGEGRVIFKVFKELKGWKVYEARSRFALIGERVAPRTAAGSAALQKEPPKKKGETPRGISPLQYRSDRTFTGT